MSLPIDSPNSAGNYISNNASVDFIAISITFLNYFIEAVYYLFLITILISGFIYLTAGDSDEKTTQAKKGILYSTIGFIITASAWAIFSYVVNITNSLNTSGDISAVFSNITAFIFNTASGIAGALFMVYLLLGGVKYLTGAGNDDQTSAAKKQMLNAGIGLILTLSAFAIGKAIAGLVS